MDIKYYTIDNILVLELKGELKHKAMYKMKPFILKVVKEDCKKIILNLEKVITIDSSWRNYLVKMYKVMSNYERKLMIANCPAYITKNGEDEKIKSLYTFYPSLEEALAYFQPEPVYKG